VLLIVPAFICSSVVEAIVEVGGVPVFADVAQDDINVDPNGIEALITRSTRAIIVAHVFGIPAQMGRLLEIGRSHSIPIIEDCCQSYGSRYAGRLTGTMGGFGIFSFGISKNISTSGGGAFCYEQGYDRAISGPLERLRLASKRKRFLPFQCVIPFAAPAAFNKHIYGLTRNAIYSYSVSKNAQPFSDYERGMTPLDAGLAIKQLGRYEAVRQMRNENASTYRAQFGDFFRLVKVPDESEPAYLYFPILTTHAKELKNRLRQYSIEVEDKDEMLFGAPYRQPRFSGYGLKRLDRVERVEDEYLLFPVGHTTAETQEICWRTISIAKTMGANSP
jgi:dTDP-4-amino-4,6-dideoxygalactose transaminase